jgi:hypothetical protein
MVGFCLCVDPTHEVAQGFFYKEIEVAYCGREKQKNRLRASSSWVSSG